ncbi:MAG: hypothetical protein K0S23_1341 [Fluviicola sp.]|jgi:hypothetical protein|uniref:hypothetical protein n=1 Tax=Fluviicola sp. TaxID=1917219 RepID=UPI00260924E0|nr:hypothetical protein [Fluviicola sp.]MDF3027034.1 hypothetical protein [Fluviicola sp.]
MSNHKTITDLIKAYASVYQEFETIQHSEILPKGDQKTGVIGEYYAKKHIESLSNSELIEYAKSGKKYDIKYVDSKTKSKIKVQVKCVSAHSNTKTIAPLNMGTGAFDKLYLIALDENFIPVGFYINEFDDLKGRLKKDQLWIRGSKMKHVGENGSRVYDFSNNRIDELLNALDK